MDERAFSEQEELFQFFGLDRARAVLRIDEICQESFKRPYSEMNGMWSEHLVFFAALSHSSFSINEILEIGTFKAETTLILSRLFPSASIVSIDLSKENLIESDIYNYLFSDIERAIQNRTELVELGGNIEFLEMNSLELISWDRKFDLIWVDGDHLSPVSILDIYNSLRMLTDNGIVLCDDVYLNSNSIDKYSDISSFSTIQSLVNAKLINARFARKRIAKIHNLGGNTKFLGVFQKAFP
jgi:predicted O-methyltransferase YrrM